MGIYSWPCNSCPKICTINTLTGQENGSAWEMGESGRCSISDCLHTSGHIYVDDMFALYAGSFSSDPRPFADSLFLCLQDLARTCPAAHTYARKQSSMHAANDSCQHDSYKDTDTNVTDVCLGRTRNVVYCLA